jgi:nicotinamidase-related amidase
MKQRDHVVKNTSHLIELAKMLGMPIVVTEQYPKGLGRTVPELHAKLSSYQPVEKTAFNCCGEPSFLTEIKKHGRKKVVIAGMETHICVLQTTIGLLKDGFIPHIASDAVCSRTKDNWKTGLGFMRDAGAVITGTETVLFQILGVAGTEEFKAVSKMIK